MEGYKLYCKPTFENIPEEKRRKILEIASKANPYEPAVRNALLLLSPCQVRFQ